MARVVIIKYNAGNIGSVEFALQRLGVEYELSDDHEQIRKADKVIFPGVGEASSTMKYLHETGLDSLIPSLTQPVLGICLGMQLMCAWSAEGDVNGLGIFPERVLKFDISEKVPHMGWNSIQFEENAFFRNIQQGAWFYFVHSYYVEKGPSCQASSYHGHEFAACLKKNNFYATQFHPEKSGTSGEQILKNFIEM